MKAYNERQGRKENWGNSKLDAICRIIDEMRKEEKAETDSE